MLVSAADEQDLLAGLRSQFNMELTVDLEEDDYPLLYEQWNVEHPDTPVGDRRLSTLSVDASETDARMIAEAAVDTISPTARIEDLRLRAGERVVMAVDAIPWFAHTRLWTE